PLVGQVRTRLRRALGTDHVPAGLLYAASEVPGAFAELAQPCPGARLGAGLQGCDPGRRAPLRGLGAMDGLLGARQVAEGALQLALGPPEPPSGARHRRGGLEGELAAAGE